MLKTRTLPTLGWSGSCVSAPVWQSGDGECDILSGSGAKHIMNETRLLWIARLIGLTGLTLLVLSSLGGTVMASKAASKVARRFPRLGGGKIFAYHRLASLIGASLFLLHPLPMLTKPSRP